MSDPLSSRRLDRPRLDVNEPRAHPDSPAGGGGPGRFRAKKNPIILGITGTDAESCYLGPTAAKADPRYCEEVKPGTKESITDKDAGVHILVERQKEGLYHWLIETLDGLVSCEGVHDPKTEFTAEICLDITSKAALRELEKEVVRTKKEAEKKPPGEPPAKREILMITIVKDDWLSKITLKRWKTIHWDRHLKPTRETLDNRRQRGEVFNPDLIYPGDTFEIIN